MKNFLSGIFVFSLALTACKKDNQSDIIKPQPSTFSVKQVAYFLEGSDSASAITHEIMPQTFNNFGQTILEMKYEENNSVLMMSSQFEFNTSLPPGGDLSKLEACVPHIIVADKVYTGDDKWPVSADKKQKPFVTDIVSLTDVKIPAKSKITVFRSLDEKLLQASFSMTVVNDLTGETTLLKGKWRGTLDYNNEKVEFKETKLD